MADAIPLYAGTSLDYTPDAGVAAGEILQLKDGRAAYAPSDISSGELGTVVVSGVVKLTKVSGVVILQGGEVWWDHSADNATYKPVNDRDFLLGIAAEDASSSSTVVKVILNEEARHLVDINRDGFLSAIIGTQAVDTMGLYRRGGAHKFILSATNEAQKVDALSVRGWATGANAIVEAVFAVAVDGAGTAVDVSIGVANGTHATDADSITESIFIHLDANNTNINAESDDGSTEVAATDTTLDYTEGSAVAQLVYVWIDMRNAADVQIYVNGALVLGATTFNVNAAAGPWFLLCHVEKTSSTDTYELHLHQLRCRIAQQ